MVPTARAVSFIGEDGALRIRQSETAAVSSHIVFGCYRELEQCNRLSPSCQLQGDRKIDIRAIGRCQRRHCLLCRNLFESSGQVHHTDQYL